RQSHPSRRCDSDWVYRFFTTCSPQGTYRFPYAALFRSPHAKVQKYFSLLNVVCLPRKNVKVCQLVSPLKPLEAMAMKVPLIVSDVAALKEMVIPGETGLVHVANDEQSLARSIISIANDKPMAEKLADNAHRLVIESRTWTQVGEVINGTYLKLTQPSQSASSEQ